MRNVYSIMAFFEKHNSASYRKTTSGFVQADETLAKIFPLKTAWMERTAMKKNL